MSGSAVRRHVGPVLPFLLLLIVMATFGQHIIHRMISPPQESTDTMTGQPLPDFTLPPVEDGQPWLKRSDILGHTSIINIFASWCAPCQAEAPLLMELKKDGAKIYGIAYRDHSAPLLTFLRAHGNPYAATGLDEKGQAVMNFGASGVPETFIVDEDGIIRWHHAGPIDQKLIKTRIDPMLRRLR